MSPAADIVLVLTLLLVLGVAGATMHDRRNARRADLARAEEVIAAIREKAYEYAELDHALSTEIRILVSDYYGAKRPKGIRR